MKNRKQTATFSYQFLRNVGLGILNDIASWIWGCIYPRSQHRTEQKKVVVSSSRRLAVSRCGVHIVPIIVSAVIVAVNLKQDFIGIDFHGLIHSETVNIALLQTAAKVQELLIVASLSTIAFQLIRDELLYGEGIPLGMLGAGIDMSKLSFFWSREFIGGLRGLVKGSRRYRKVQLVVFLLLAGALSLLAGPACAVLLVPQIQDWPIGGTPVSLNGTEDSFWPVEMTGNSSQPAICLSPGESLNGVCPSGGYRSLWSHYYNLDSTTYADYVPAYAYQLSGNHYYWPVESVQPMMTRTISLGWPKLTVWMVQPHLAASIVLEQLMKGWWQALLASGSYQDSEIIDRAAASSLIYNPLVRVNCAPPAQLSSSNHSVLFPVIDSPDFRTLELDGSVLPDNPKNHVQFSWIHLDNNFRPVTTGAVLQSAWSHDNESRLVIGCSVAAQWVKANVRSDSYSFWQGWYPKSIDFDHPYPIQGSILKNGSVSTQDAIVVDESWLNSLTPATPPTEPGYLDWKPTTIESILSAVRITEGTGNNNSISVNDWQTEDNSNRPGLLASVIASIFVDGLSRAGVQQLFTNQGNPSQWILSPYEEDPNFDNLMLRNKRALKYPPQNDMFRVDFGISGLNYSMSLAQKLAMIVLFLHIALAAFHSVWLITRGKSSACWDSMTEIMAIAQNSKPAIRSLENTAAGIQYSSTFSKRVIVSPAKLPGSQEDSHLEFEIIEEETDMEKKMVELELSDVEIDQSTRSSNIESDGQPLETIKLLHSKTWTPGESHSRATSSSSVNLARGRRSSSSRAAPVATLAPSSGRPFTELKFKENVAYG